VIQQQHLAGSDVGKHVPQSHQPVIARLNRVASCLLQVRQKARDDGLGDISSSPSQFHMSVMSDSEEDRIMATALSVTLWLRQLKQGDRQAVQPLWERYFTRLVHLARTWFPRTPTTAAASAEDAALDAFASFCRRAEADGFAHLFDRDDLWQILIVLAFRKRCTKRNPGLLGKAPAAAALPQLRISDQLELDALRAFGRNDGNG
jgi:hypothetical protein